MLEVLNPATEEVVESLEPATEDDADAAIARAGKPSRRGDVQPDDRSRLLRRLADALDGNRRTWRNWSRRTPASP